MVILGLKSSLYTFSHHFLSQQSGYSIRSRFFYFLFFLFLCFSRRLGASCGCRLLGATFVCLCQGATIICVRAIQTSTVYPINNKKSNQWSSICYKTRIICILVTIVDNYKCVFRVTVLDVRIVISFEL